MLLANFSEWYDGLSAQDVFHLIARTCVVLWGLILIVPGIMASESNYPHAQQISATLLVSALLMIISSLVISKPLFIATAGSYAVVLIPFPASDRLLLTKLLLVWIVLGWTVAHELRLVEKWPHEFFRQRNQQGNYDAVSTEMNMQSEYDPPSSNDPIQVL